LAELLLLQNKFAPNMRIAAMLVRQCYFSFTFLSSA